MENLLLVFAKEPKEGHVKTRLARVIGDGPAKRVYEAFLKDTVINIRDDELYETKIVCTPESSIANLDALLGFKDISHQKGDTLTERLASAFDDSFKSGYKKVVAIGSDAPLLDRHVVRESLKRLDDSDCVIGPASDGGYYLIGMRKCDNRIFSGISWSTKKVFEQTVDRVRELGLTASIMEKMSDVDEYDDLLSLKKTFNDLTEAEKRSNINVSELFKDVELI